MGESWDESTRMTRVQWDALLQRDPMSALSFMYQSPPSRVDWAKVFDAPHPEPPAPDGWTRYDRAFLKALNISSD